MSISSPHVLLVSMPWASTCRPNLAIGTLVAIARQLGFSCQSTYPNLTFSTVLGHELYEYFADTPALFPLAEHLFAVDIFGKERLDSDSYLDRLAASFTATSGSNPLYNLRDELCSTFIENCAETIMRNGADIIGFSCTFNQVLPSLAVAKRIKSVNPGIKVLLGGACVHDKMGEAYARAFSQFVDHVFTGEADETFIHFLRASATNSEVKNIPGVTYLGKLQQKAEVIQTLDELPVPNYDDYFSERDRLKQSEHNLAENKNLPYESSRGCWWGEVHHCTFCGLNNIGMKYRAKSPEKVIGELLELSAKYHSVNFMAADNILDFAGYQNLLPRISELPLDLNLFYEIKANIKRNDVAALAGAGARWVQPGIESFSDNVLKLMRKGVSALQNIQTLKWLEEYGIAPSYNVLVGFDGETDEDYETLLKIIQSISHLPPPSGSATIVQVHRFSPFHFEPGKHGIRNLRAESYYKHLVPPDVLPAEEFAYFFRHELVDDAPVFRYLKRLNEAICAWRNSTKRMSAKLGVGFIEIEIIDQEVRQTQTLDLVTSLIFVLADQQTSISKVVKEVEALLTEKPTDIAGAVKSLIQRGFVIENSDRILSAVPFQKRHTSETLASWITHCAESTRILKPDMMKVASQTTLFSPAIRTSRSLPVIISR